MISNRNTRNDIYKIRELYEKHITKQSQPLTSSVCFHDLERGFIKRGPDQSRIKRSFYSAPAKFTQFSNSEYRRVHKSSREIKKQK